MELLGRESPLGEFWPSRPQPVSRRGLPRGGRELRGRRRPSGSGRAGAGRAGAAALAAWHSRARCRAGLAGPVGRRCGAERGGRCAPAGGSGAGRPRAPLFGGRRRRAAPPLCPPCRREPLEPECREWGGGAAGRSGAVGQGEAGGQGSVPRAAGAPGVGWGRGQKGSGAGSLGQRGQLDWRPSGRWSRFHGGPEEAGVKGWVPRVAGVSGTAVPNGQGPVSPRVGCLLLCPWAGETGRLRQGRGDWEPHARGLGSAGMRGRCRA